MDFLLDVQLLKYKISTYRLKAAGVCLSEIKMIVGKDDNDHPENVWPQRYQKADVPVTPPS